MTELRALVDIVAGQTVDSVTTGEQGVCALAAVDIPAGTPIVFGVGGRAYPAARIEWPELLFREGEPRAMSTGTPAGGAAERRIYDRQNLPAGDWRWYRRRTATRMVQVGGPFIVHTIDGAVALPKGWRGYVAVDDTGHLYPVADEVHRASYEPAGEPTT